MNQFDPTLPEWRAIFPAKLTARRTDTDTGIYLYSWEEVIQGGDGTYTKAVPGRFGKCGDGTTANPAQNAAREVNNAAVTADDTTQPIVWMRVRGQRGSGDVVYEFNDAGLAGGGGGGPVVAAVTGTVSAYLGTFYTAVIRTYLGNGSWADGDETVILQLLNRQNLPTVTTPPTSLYPAFEIGTIDLAVNDAPIATYRLLICLDANMPYAYDGASYRFIREVAGIAAHGTYLSYPPVGDTLYIGCLDAGPTQKGAVTVDQQTFAGLKQFTNGIAVGGTSSHQRIVVSNNPYSALSDSALVLSHAPGSSTSAIDVGWALGVRAITFVRSGGTVTTTVGEPASTVNLTGTLQVDGATLPSGTITYTKGGGGTGTITVTKGHITSWT